MDIDILSEILGQHPAKRMDFDDLYAGLLENVENRYINRQQQGDLELFNYSASAVFDKQWNVYTLISRGLILEPKQKKVIATPFPKFFNYGESSLYGSHELKGKTIALEKLDGSLGIVFHHNGRWLCTTRGSFVSDQAVWGTNWINNNLDTSLLDVGHTYLFEIIYPENQIVVNYDFEGMVLLSAYCDKGFEYDHGELDGLKDNVSVRKAEYHCFENIDALIKSAKSIDRNYEGWVVQFPNGHKVKIKGEEYCRVHRLMSNVTPLGIWELMMNMDDMDDMDDMEGIRRDLPEEHLKDFDSISSIINNNVDELVRALEASLVSTRDLSNKDVGLSIARGSWPDGSSITDIERKFLFSARKDELLQMLSAPGKSRQAIFKYLKPRANILDGYRPSNAINRFQQEAS